MSTTITLPRRNPPATTATRRPIAFWLLAFVFAAVMLGTTLPTPLYVIYQGEWHFSTSVITLIYAVYAAGVSAASMPLFLASTVVSGVSVGAVFMGSLATANRVAPAEARGQVISTFFVFCYVGLTIPVIGVGFGAQAFGDFRAILACAIVLAAIALASMAVIRRSAT